LRRRDATCILISLPHRLNGERKERRCKPRNTASAEKKQRRELIALHGRRQYLKLVKEFRADKVLELLRTAGVEGSKNG